MVLVWSLVITLDGSLAAIFGGSFGLAGAGDLGAGTACLAHLLGSDDCLEDFSVCKENINQLLDIKVLHCARQWNEEKLSTKFSERIM